MTHKDTKGITVEKMMVAEKILLNRDIPLPENKIDYFFKYNNRNYCKMVGGEIVLMNIIKGKKDV